MAKSSSLKFNCPSCGRKLGGIEPATSHTQVVKRTCVICGDRWQLVVKVLKASRTSIDHRDRRSFRVDKVEISFIDNRQTRKDFKLQFGRNK